MRERRVKETGTDRHTNEGGGVGVVGGERKTGRGRESESEIARL